MSVSLWASRPVTAVRLASAGARVGVRSRLGEPWFLFRNRECSAANATSVVAGFGLFLPLAYFPVFLQISSAMAATHSGLLAAGLPPDSPVSGLDFSELAATPGGRRDDGAIRAGCRPRGGPISLSRKERTLPSIYGVSLA